MVRRCSEVIERKRLPLRVVGPLLRPHWVNAGSRLLEIHFGEITDPKYDDVLQHCGNSAGLSIHTHLTLMAKAGVWYASEGG